MIFFYPDDLPISARKQDITDSIRQNQVIVISGDTGSGKTTQLPKMCLEILGNSDLLIGCTQPRRIAATSVAERVADELENREVVGYKIRFHDHTTEKTRIKFMTDGVLLAESRHDPLLSRYGVIIIDEAHERNLNIDFLLGYIKNLLNRRRDLKIIISSATIDTRLFATHFGNAPVISVSGRAHPVTVRYDPPQAGDDEDGENLLEHCVNKTVELYRSNPKGDILIFLPTEKDIRECCRLLSGRFSGPLVLPLYGRLSLAEQKKIFSPSKHLKIVVATNVAETSITVPGIRYVIDSGLARISHYNTRAKTTALPISKVSQASCNQRKGRCGRIGSGLCIRLYSEEDFNNRDEFTLPEIKRSNLAEVILQMISLGFGDPDTFPFMEPPFKASVREGYRLLTELGAINSRKQLTANGRLMSDLPIDPCISRILIEATNNQCLREVTVIASVLAIQDPRVRPADQEQKADLAHASFSHRGSDFLALLNIWNRYHEQEKSVKSWSALKRFCRDNYLSFQRMRDWFDLHAQLSRILATQQGFTDNSRDGSYEQIHKSLMAGFLRNLAVKKLDKMYQGAHNKELMVFPGSQQFGRSGQWIMAATFLETNRLYALTVATIEPEWAESLGRHLCRYSWSEPHYSKKTGQVMALESVSLFGLPIVNRRKVTYGRQNDKVRKEARDIFIHEALVAGGLAGNYAFLTNNHNLINKWKDAEDKLRLRNILADETAIHDFYDRNLPESVYNRPTLNRHLKKQKSKNDFLFMQEEDILLRRPEEQEVLDYPPFCLFGQITIYLEYRFTPGSEDDGVTFRLPVHLAMTMQPAFFEWLVPGMLPEKITFLLKGLPKQLRKRLVPVNETVNLLLDDMEYRSGSLYTSLEGSILKHFKMLIRASDWPSLPPHLLARILIVDDRGETVASGRDLQQLVADFDIRSEGEVPPQLTPANEAVRQKWENSEHNTWAFDDLPGFIPVNDKSGAVTGLLYPVIDPHPDRQCVKVTFARDRQSAEKLTSQGILYLVWLQLGPQHKALKKYAKTALSGPSATVFSRLGLEKSRIISLLLDYVLQTAMHVEPSRILEDRLFQATVERLKKDDFFSRIQAVLEQIMALYRKRLSLEKAIRATFSSGVAAKSYPQGKSDQFLQVLDDVFPVDFFFSRTGLELEDIDRQLQSLTIRLDRFIANPSKDENKQGQLAPFLARLAQLEENRSGLGNEAMGQLEIFRKMVNEYRISVFSPEIKTRITVSPQKLEKQWKKIKA
jgi:ATP-dependent helicase HrpA